MKGDLTEAEEKHWCAEQRQNVLSYLSREGFDSPKVGEWPAWHAAPIVSVWAVESLERPGWVGWWAVSGDFPADYTTCKGERDPRQALRDIGLRWREAAAKWMKGKRAPDWGLDSPESENELAPLLATRANLFLQFAADDSIWTDS